MTASPFNTYYLFDGNQREAAFLFSRLSTTTSILAFACIPLVTYVSRKNGKEATLALTGPIIDLIGFDAALGANQGGYVFPTMIGVLFGLPMATSVAALWLLRRYPLDYAKAIDIRTALEERRGEFG